MKKATIDPYWKMLKKEIEKHFISNRNYMTSSAMENYLAAQVFHHINAQADSTIESHGTKVIQSAQGLWAYLQTELAEIVERGN